MHLAHIILDGLDDAVNQRFFELDVAQPLDDVLLEAEHLLLDGEGALVAVGQGLVKPFVKLALLLEDGLDFVEQQDDPLPLVHLVLAGIVFFDGFDHILELDAVLAQFFAHVDELFNGHGHFGKGIEHVLLALFDLLGDDDLAVPVKERHGTHLPEIHAHGVSAAGRVVGGILVVRDIDGILIVLIASGVGAGGDFLPLLFGIHDGNFQLFEDADNLFELFRGVHLHRKRLVHFIKSEVAAALTFGNERLHLLDVFKIAHLSSPRGVSEGLRDTATRRRNRPFHHFDAMLQKAIIFVLWRNTCQALFLEPAVRHPPSFVGGPPAPGSGPRRRVQLPAVHNRPFRLA